MAADPNMPGGNGGGGGNGTKQMSSNGNVGWLVGFEARGGDRDRLTDVDKHDLDRPDESGVDRQIGVVLVAGEVDIPVSTAKGQSRVAPAGQEVFWPGRNGREAYAKAETIDLEFIRPHGYVSRRRPEAIDRVLIDARRRYGCQQKCTWEPVSPDERLVFVDPDNRVALELDWSEPAPKRMTWYHVEPNPVFEGQSPGTVTLRRAPLSTLGKTIYRGSQPFAEEEQR